MDMFRRNLEAAQAQALSAALTAQKSARGFAQSVSEQGKALAGNLSENTKVLAEQATTLSSTAQSRLRTLELPSGLNARLGALAKPAEAEPVPESELLAYGITAEFREFIRSLTYSTFRDFPQDALPASSQEPNTPGGSTKYLTPWQERHAMLVVQSTREINELRYEGGGSGDGSGPAHDGSAEHGGNGNSGEDDEAEDDFDRYLSELNEEGGSGGGSLGGDSGEDSGEELDLSEYMRDVK
ncbi:hypothetical protein WJX81_000637 [Elliptochloris bilobata]|uniref:BSD domain-containing protein n=1 Tax=Elliptochloris bilobata TaxID=381761 RepID=A0AAW1SAD7_9CHLO